MKVKLLNSTPLSISDIAICKCYMNKPHDTDEKRMKRIKTVANQNKHASVIEHLVYNFDVDGVSRGLLQELARHRIASYTVKSSRYTLQELKKEEPIVVQHLKYRDINHDIAKKYLVFTGDPDVDDSSCLALANLQRRLIEGISNDKAKYCMPESYKTSLVWTINARSLQNFLTLRTDKKALWEIRDLANCVYDNLPEEHKPLFEECVK